MDCTQKFFESVQQQGCDVSTSTALGVFDISRIATAKDVKGNRAYEEEGYETEDGNTSRNSLITYAVPATFKANPVNVERIWGHDTDEEVVILGEDDKNEPGTSTGRISTRFDNPALCCLPPKKRNRDVRVCLVDNGRRDHWDIVEESEGTQRQAQRRARISIADLLNDEPLMTVPPKLKRKKGSKSIRALQSQTRTKEDDKQVSDAMVMSDSVMNYHDESEKMVKRESGGQCNEEGKKRKRGSGSEEAVQRIQPRRSCKNLKLMGSASDSSLGAGTSRFLSG